MWNEVILRLTQMMCYNANLERGCYNAYILLLIRQINDAEENLSPTIFHAPESTVIFWESNSMHEMDTHPN